MSLGGTRNGTSGAQIKKNPENRPPQTSPQNPQVSTLGTQIRPRKVIFGNFIDFGHFSIEIPIEVQKNYGQRKEWSYSKNKKCSEICEQNGTTWNHVEVEISTFIKIRITLLNKEDLSPDYPPLKTLISAEGKFFIAAEDEILISAEDKF